MAIDYCCTEEEILDGENQFHIFVPQEGRRRFQQDRECFLKIAALRNKLLFAGDERIIGWCRERFGKENGAWFMQPAKLRELDRELSRYGYGIDFMQVLVSPSNEYITDLPNVILLISLALFLVSLTYYLCKKDHISKNCG